MATNARSVRNVVAVATRRDPRPRIAIPIGRNREGSRRSDITPKTNWKIAATRRAGAARGAGPERAEREGGLEARDLARHDRDPAVVREVVEGVRDEDPAVADHTGRDAFAPYRLRRVRGGPPP